MAANYSSSVTLQSLRSLDQLHHPSYHHSSAATASFTPAAFFVAIEKERRSVTMRPRHHSLLTFNFWSLFFLAWFAACYFLTATGSGCISTKLERLGAKVFTYWLGSQELQKYFHGQLFCHTWCSRELPCYETNTKIGKRLLNISLRSFHIHCVICCVETYTYSRYGSL